MANLTEIFNTAEEPVQDTDKLVDLFRNRSELKKEFAALRNEKYQLEDRIREHRGSIERVEQKLNHLEALLLDPAWVHNVVTFYQLRRLSAHCEARLGRFAEQLKQQREKRIREISKVAWERELHVDRQRVVDRLAEHRMRLQVLEDQLQAERDKLRTKGGLSRLVGRRTRVSDIESVESSLAAEREAEAELLRELERIGDAEPPPHAGLDIAAKRSINFMILSFLQQLYLEYCEDDLAAMAKEASDKSVGAVNYGSKQDCDEIFEQLVTRREEVGRGTAVTATLQKRAKLIAEHAVFRNDDETVPVSDSVAIVFDIKAGGAVAKTDVNLLGENYFKIASVLSR